MKKDTDRVRNESEVLPRWSALMKNTRRQKTCGMKYVHILVLSVRINLKSEGKSKTCLSTLWPDKELLTESGLRQEMG